MTFQTSAFQNNAFQVDLPQSSPDGGRIRHRRIEPEELSREQRMVQEYLDSLDRQKQLVERRAPAREIKRVAAARPILTEAVMKAANEYQIERVLRESADARDRAIADMERRRRYWARFLVLAVQ
jgi:hypothetical protein